MKYRGTELHAASGAIQVGGYLLFVRSGGGAASACAI
jgi:hypothetical protein